jgi:hypothetical protein
MERLALYIRLFIATVAAIGSTAFVVVYTRLYMSIDGPKLKLQHTDFPGATKFVADYGWHIFVIPVCFLFFGVFVIHRWKSKAAFELVVGCQWLFAFLWLAFCLLVCLLAEIQTITPMHGPPPN